jgi:DNA polymerase-3 subunit epsilon
MILPNLNDLEALAQTLQADPDFRVMRRLKPRLHWPAAGAASVTRVLVLDTETTGLDPSREKIIELALLRVDIDNASGLPVGEVLVFDELEDPGIPIPAQITEITGITDADVKGKQLDEARIAQMLDGVDVIIAHNAGFDRPFCESRLPLFKEFAWACSFADIDWKAHGRSSSKLEMLAHALGLFYDAQRAEMDCHALIAVLAAPLPKAAFTGFAALLTAAKNPAFRLQATQAPFEAKDKLKSRGYRWDGEGRVWWCSLSSDELLEAECTWLRSEVYDQRKAQVQLEAMDSRVQFSSRPGQLSEKAI